MQVLWAEQQIARSRVKRKAEFHVRNDGTADFNDPLFEDEWYIVSLPDNSIVSLLLPVAGHHSIHATLTARCVCMNVHVHVCACVCVCPVIELLSRTKLTVPRQRSTLTFFSFFKVKTRLIPSCTVQCRQGPGHGSTCLVSQDSGVKRVPALSPHAVN